MNTQINSTNVGVILAAGSGKRFNETLSLSHKCMMRSGGQTFLENTITQMSEVCDIIYVVIGHKPEIISAHLKEIQASIGSATEIVILENPIYNKTNNITSMKLVLDHMNEFDIYKSLNKMYYAESDILYVQAAEVFRQIEATDKITNSNDNYRGIIDTPPHKEEWRPVWNEDGTIQNYTESAESGAAIIGFAKYNAEFVKSLYSSVCHVDRYDQNIYWDEAERQIMHLHKVYGYDLSYGNEIFEIDDEKDLIEANTLNLNVTI